MAGNGSSGVQNGTAVRFSYAGVRTIVVKGAATGHIYRFAPGTSLNVQASDAASMREIPGLRPQDISVAAAK